MFSTGSPCVLGDGSHRLARERQPARRDRVLLGPGARQRRPVPARGAGRQVGLVHRLHLAQGAHPAGGVALGAAAVEALGGEQRRAVARHRLGGGHDRGVGDDPAGRHVALRGDLVAGLPQGAYGAQRPAAAHPVQAGGTAPGLDAGGLLEGAQVVELLAGPVGLAGLDQLGGQRVPQLDEHLDVEGGVLQPRRGQRPRRPVDGRVLLGQPVAQQRLDQRRQPDPRVAEQPPGQLGVEQRGGGEPDLVEAGQVLGGGVQDPLGVLERLLQRGQRGERDRVDQPGRRALAAQLDQVGAGGVAVARGPLGVDGHRAGAGAELGADVEQGRLGLDDGRKPVAEVEQRLGGLRLGGVVRGRLGGAVPGGLGDGWFGSGHEAQCPEPR